MEERIAINQDTIWCSWVSISKIITFYTWCDWFSCFGRNVAIEVKGNSMEYDLQSGEIVIIDRVELDVEKIKKGSLYAVRYDGENYIKHLSFEKSKKRLHLKSANPQFSRDNTPQSIDLDQTEENPLIGKVVFSYGRWK